MQAYFQKPTDGEPDVEFSVSSDGKIQSVKKSSSDEMRIRNTTTDRRTSNMPGAPRNQDFAGSKRDIATEFTDSYQKAGIQPSSLDDAPKARPVEYENTPYKQPYQDRTPQPQKSKKRRKKVIPPVTPVQVGITVLRSGKLRVTAVNFWLWAWGGWIWLWFQLPIAIVSLAFMALTQILWSIENAGIAKSQTDPGWFSAIMEAAKMVYQHAVNAVTALAWWVLETWLDLFTDIDLNIVGNLFMLTHLIVFLIGIITLVLCYIQYKIAFIHPLGGRAAAFKMGMLMLAIICYSIPFLNLFPWFFLWTFAVWLYPK